MSAGSDSPDGGAGSLARAGEWEAAYTRMCGRDEAAALTDGDALEMFATCAYMTGREDAYIDLMGRAFDAHAQADAPLRAARAAFWIGLTLMFRGETGLGGGWLARAETLVGDHGGPCAESGYIMLPRVEASFGAGDNQAAERIATEALAIGEKSGDADLAAIARHLVGRARMALGDIPGGLSAMDETMVATTEGRLSPIVTGLIYCSVIEACQRYQALRRASEWTEALSSWCAEQPELVAFTGRCLVHRSEILLFDGRWPEAETEARAAARRLAEGPAKHHAGPAFYQQGEVHRLQGRFEAADESYRAASALGFDPQPGLALMRLQQGRLQAAGAAIRRALAASDAPTLRMRLLPAAFEIALAAGDRAAATASCTEMEELAQTYASDAVAARVAEMRGDLGLTEGDAGLALRCYARAAALWREMQAPYQLCRVRQKTARACAMLGDAEGGLAEAQAALEGFARLGAEPDRKAVEAVMRQCDPARPAILTPRQTEVLTMIAAGLTNREIAARLGLSERTVDRHVSDILTRIDVPTRAAAVAFALTSGLMGSSGSG